MTAQHSKNPKLSWYGESVGENGDTLVVDTVGLNNKTFLDAFWTPHSPDLHVVERDRLINNGQAMEVNLRIEDPGAFKAPYEVTQRYHRGNESWLEFVCAENPLGPLDQVIDPIPQVAKSDF